MQLLPRSLSICVRRATMRGGRGFKGIKCKGHDRARTRRTISHRGCEQTKPIKVERLKEVLKLENIDYRRRRHS